MGRTSRTLEQADAIVAEDFIEYDPLPGQAQGREGLKDAIRQMLTSFPDMHWVIEEMVAEGDKVCTRFTWTGTHEGHSSASPPPADVSPSKAW